MGDEEVDSIDINDLKLSELDSEDDEGDLPINTESKKVLMEPKDITLFQYKRWHEKGRLNLNPDWQRAYV